MSESIVGNRVSLKDRPDYVGVVKALHLKANDEKGRKKDLFKVLWDKGTVGIVEAKDLINQNK
jgi:hypothetical protein